MKGEVNREHHYYTAGEWIDKKPIVLSAWRTSQDPQGAGVRSRMQAAGTLKAKALIKRLAEMGIR